MTKSEWASWAQALGTILAVLFAFATAWWTTTREERRTAMAAGVLVHQLIAEAHRMQLAGQDENYADLKTAIDSMEAAIQRAEKFPTDRLGINAASNFHEALRMARQFNKDAQAIDPMQPFIGCIESRAEVVIRNLHSLADAFRLPKPRGRRAAVHARDEEKQRK